MLYLIRHGATLQPRLRDAGDLTPATREEWLLDYGLSARGVIESNALSGRLDAMGAPDRVMSSPRKRTLETAAGSGLQRPVLIDERLHEWHGEEPVEALRDRVNWLLSLGEEGTSVVFTHGAFIRAVMAGVMTRNTPSTFAAVFHDLRRAMNIWNGSITLVGHGVDGLELLAVNLCPAIDELTGRRNDDGLL